METQADGIFAATKTKDCFRAVHGDLESFDGAKTACPGRSCVPRNLAGWASAATPPAGCFGPPKAGLSGPLDGVASRLWPARPRRETRLASKPERPVKRFHPAVKRSSVLPIRSRQEALFHVC